jgi:hypothetical protein
MRLNAKLGIATAISALAVTGPAVAQACTNGQGQGSAQDQHAAKFRTENAKFSHGFRHHKRWYGRSVTGTLVSWSATETGTQTYSGSITVTEPAFKSHHASQATIAQPTQVTYTFTNAKVIFGQGANPPAAGDLVSVIGTGLASHHRGAGTATSTSTPTIRALIIRAPHTSTPST